MQAVGVSVMFAPIMTRLRALGLALLTLRVARMVRRGWLRPRPRHGSGAGDDEKNREQREQDDVEHAQRHHANGREQIIRTG